MTIQSDLLAEIEQVLAALELSESAFGVAAVNDWRFMRRLREGKNMTLATLDRARAHLDTLRADAAKRADALQKIAAA